MMAATIRGRPATLWSETMLEMLLYALRKNRSDKELKEIVRELRGKGYRAGALIAKVEKEVGAAEAYRLRSFL